MMGVMARLAADAAQASRPSAASEAVGASLMAFVVVYFVLFGAGTVYVLRLFLHGPSRPETEAVTARDPVGAAILGKDAGGAP